MDTPLLYKRLGSTIKERRKQLGLTQEQLCRQLEISRASLANIETGRQRLLVHQLYRVARNLGMMVTDLLPPLEEAEELEVLGRISISGKLSVKERQQVARFVMEGGRSSDS